MEKHEHKNEMDNLEGPSTLELRSEVTVEEFNTDKNEFLDRLSVAASNLQCTRPIQPEDLQEDQNLRPEHEEEEQMQIQEEIESLSWSPRTLLVVSANIEVVTEQQQERTITETVSKDVGLTDEMAALKKELEEVKNVTAAKLLELQEEIAALKKDMEERKALQREALKKVTAQQPRDVVRPKEEAIELYVDPVESQKEEATELNVDPVESQKEEATELNVDPVESLKEEKPALQNEGENQPTEAHKETKAAGQLKEIIQPQNEELKPDLEQNQSQQKIKNKKKLSRWKRFKKSEWTALLGQCLCCMVFPLLACFA
ncbi:zinc finger protein 853 [Etheostoma spectabile]|uniref:zinc finger protein 853 n=1 Tax=Etheostoma spectabile TaxID=54343 RepID=UPI0013AEB224|nr:zinc finger protein 853-like [Etheostoma spectabile]